MVTPGSEKHKPKFGMDKGTKLGVKQLEDKLSSKFESKFSFNSYDNAFMLRKLHKNCYMDTVIADFVPLGHNESEGNKGKWHAVYLKDRMYFTPAFVMGRDAREIIENPIREMEKFQEKYEEIVSKVAGSKKDGANIRQARPGGRKCQICKEEYEDYKDHVREQKHLRLFRKSKGLKYEKEFIEEFNKRQENSMTNSAANKNIKYSKHFQKGTEAPKKTKKIAKTPQRRGSKRIVSTSESVEHAQSDEFIVSN